MENLARDPVMPPENKNSEQLTADWYKTYYAKRGEDRNSILLNPQCDFQVLAAQLSVIRSLRKISYTPQWKCLDVGCGTGQALIPFLMCGAIPSRLHGIDILPDRIEEAKSRYPACGFTACDARKMSFPEEEFDLISESTMFIQITDETMATEIAAGMVRSTKKNGYIVLMDWRYDGGRTGYRALSKTRIRRLFDVGDRTEIVSRERAALVPPVGRMLSARLPSLYFIAGLVFPFLSGQMTTVLRRIK